MGASRLGRGRGVLVLLGLAACGGPGMPVIGDPDHDGVRAPEDLAPDDPLRCGDRDGDGCDDCSVRGLSRPGDDGWDPDGDGACDLSLSYRCMNGAGAADDPFRAEACAVFALINADRLAFADESGGGAPLRWSEEIWRVSSAHARDMCERGYFDHVNPEGLDPSGRAGAAGLDFGLAENISVDLDPRSAAYHLMSEPTCRGHRGNILDARAVEVAVGYHVCDNPSYEPFGQHHHVVQNFHIDSGLEASAFCRDPETACELPPEPPSTAVCPESLLDIGFCPALDSSLLMEWGCPAD